MEDAGQIPTVTAETAAEGPIGGRVAESAVDIAIARPTSIVKTNHAKQREGFK